MTTGAATLPSSAAPSERVEALEGILVVSIADDFRRGTSDKRFAFHVSGRPDRELKFPDKIPDGLRTGMRVMVSGVISGNELRLHPGTYGFRVLGQPVPDARTAPVSARKVLLILTDIVDGSGVNNAVSGNCDGTQDLVSELMFGAVSNGPNTDGCFVESSFGAMGFGGASYPGTPLDVIRVSINDSALSLGGVCNHNDWAYAADAQATNMGVNLNAYQHISYVLPQAVGCSWGGLGNLDCLNYSYTRCRTWISTYSWLPCSTKDVYSHELGHNVGFGHASTDANNDGVIDSEYGDYSDFMGNNLDVLRETSGPHKLQLGWIPGTEVINATGGGTFTLSATEVETPAFPRLLRIAAASNATYYVSFRLPIGYDATMPSGSSYWHRSSIHRYAGGNANTLLVATLGDGETFTDNGHGFSIKQLSRSGDTVTVQVTTGSGGTCTAQTPQVSLSPSSFTATGLPATAQYTLSVTNNDSAACPTNTFTFDRSLPAGWTASFAASSLTLAPGTSGSTTLSVTAPTGTSNGTYALSAGTNADASHAAASASANFIVNVSSGTCSWAAPTVSLSPASQTTTVLPAAKSYTVTVTNRDTSACISTTFPLTAIVPAGWTGSISPASVTLAPGASAAATLTANAPASATNGSYTIRGGTKIAPNHASVKASAIFDVNVGGGSSCTVAAPTSNLSPGSRTLSAVPASTSFTLTVNNLDSSACSTTSFPLTAAVPAGWTGSLSASSLSLAPGTSGTATLTVNAPSSAGNGNYSVTAGTGTAGSHAASSGSATVTVSLGGGGTDTTPPTAPGSLTATLKYGRVTLLWLASSDSGSGVAMYRVYRNNVEIAATTSLSYKDYPTTGTWSYVVKAVDNAGNVSAASNQVTVTK
jgi:hypothetical protein